jgi:hypothetical protein
MLVDSSDARIPLTLKEPEENKFGVEQQQQQHVASFASHKDLPYYG